MKLTKFLPEDIAAVKALDTAISEQKGVKTYNIEYIEYRSNPTIIINVTGGDLEEIARVICRKLPPNIDTKGDITRTIKLAGEKHYRTIQINHSR